MQAAHRQSCISCFDHLVYYARTILVIFQVDQQARSVLDRSAKGNWHSMHWIAAQLLTFAPLHVGLFLMKRPGGAQGECPCLCHSWARQREYSPCDETGRHTRQWCIHLNEIPLPWPAPD